MPILEYGNHIISINFDEFFLQRPRMKYNGHVTGTKLHARIR